MSIAYARAYRPSAVTLPSFILLRAVSLFIVHRLLRAVRLPCSYFFVCSRALTRCGSNSPECQIASYVNNFIWKFQLLYCKETAQNSCEITTTAESPLSSLDPANHCIANLYPLRAFIKHRNSIHTNDLMVT